MKIKRVLIFYYNRISGYFLTNRLIFLFYTIGAIMAAIVLMYAYGNILSYNKFQVDNNYEYKIYKKNYQSYSLDFVTESSDNLKAKYNAIKNIYVTKKYNSKDSIDFSKYKGGAFYLVADLKDGYSFYEYSGRVDFTQDEKDGVEHAVILPTVGVDNSNMNSIIGSKIQILGTNFTVIGLYQTQNPVIIIPFNDFKSKTDEIDWTYINTGSILNKKSIDEIYEVYSKNDSDIKMETPSIESGSIRDYTGRIVSVINMYILAMISFLFLFKYLIDCRSYENTIMSLCGATKNKITKMIMIDNIIMSSFPTLIGMAIYAILKPILFDKISLEGIVFGPFDYLIIYFCVIIASLLTSIPFMVNFYFKNPIDTKNLYVK